MCKHCTYMHKHVQGIVPRKLCKEIISHAHQERRDGGNRQKMSGIQHGEKEMEEKDELTFIRKRNRSVQVFDVWKMKT